MQLKHYNKGAIAKRNCSFLSFLLFSLKRFFFSLYFFFPFSLFRLAISLIYLFFFPNLDLPVTSDLSQWVSMVGHDGGGLWVWFVGTVMRLVMRHGGEISQCVGWITILFWWLVVFGRWLWFHFIFSFFL